MADGNGLHPRAERILHIDIVHAEIIFVDTKGPTSVVGPCCTCWYSGCEDRLVASVRRGVSRVPINLQDYCSLATYVKWIVANHREGSRAGDVDLLGVRSRENKNGSGAAIVG